MSHILKVEGLTVYRGQHLALRNVGFELELSTNTAIIGPNGAGKSTLVEAILGLIQPTAGQIILLGRPVAQMGKVCQELGYIPQHFIFDRTFPLSVEELVGLGLDLNGKKIRKIDKSKAIANSLQRVGMYPYRHRAIGNLSGGQLKRVLLAYCLVRPRKLLILDEAFAGIDPQGIQEFYNLLHDLKLEENWTILQVSHDINMVNQYCDRVIYINETLASFHRNSFNLIPLNVL